MKKLLVPLLVLALLCVSAAVLAEGNAITISVNTATLPVYEADDPYLEGFGMKEQPEDDVLPVLILPVKKNLVLPVTVKPDSVKNKGVTLSVDSEKYVRVQGRSVYGLKAGETVLTIASRQDPSVRVRYRVLVIRQITRIALTASKSSVPVGQTVKLTAEYTPKNATMKAVTWSTSDSRIATVDKKGNVTGLKKGYVRITAAAKDGSKIRANINLQVVQIAEKLTLDKKELTVNTAGSAVLKATVLPADTNDKNVVWSSSDESIAKVNAYGRVTGVAPGECEITCTSRTNKKAQAKAVIRVQQPVKKVTFGAAPAVYAGESAKLTWTVEPANATNKGVTFKSGNEKILTVDKNGKVTGVKAGETYVSVITKDGSNRQARIRVKVYQHVTGVHMKRKTAYIDLRTSSTASAILEPERWTNHNMTWKSADPSVAKAAGTRKPGQVSITGVSKGTTVITGKTEDGGHKTSITVKVGDFSHMLRITSASIGGKGQLYIRVRNVSDDLPISYVKLELEMYNYDGSKAPVNTKDGSNVIQAVYSRRLDPGQSTPEDRWTLKDFDKDLGFQAIIVRVVEYQIDNDWVKVLPKNRQPKYEYNPWKKK